MMYRGMGADNRNRPQIGRSPPRRRRSPEDENKFCIYCKVQLSSSRLFEEHKGSAVHKQKEILIGKALSDGLQYCYTCEKIFPSKLALDAHCLMTRHKPLYRVDELQELINKNANTNNVPPPRPPESRRAREEKERQDIVSKLNEVRGTDETTDKNVHVNDKDKRTDNSKTGVENKGFFCDVCNVDCMNQSNFKIHSESWRHRSEMDKKKDEEKQKFDKEAEQQFDAAEEIERKKVPAHLTGKAGYFCEVCSIASVSESAYLDHLKNRKHFRQVGQMRRPYKCYFCDVEFNVAKDFNYHLESRSHMDKAFKKENKSKKRDKDDEWVEKKTERREHRDKDSSRDSRKDDRARSRTWHSEKDEHRDRRSKDQKKDSRKTEFKDSAPRQTDGRKVEIVDVDNAADTGIKDLREKLKAQKNIIITKSNSPERLEESRNEESQLPEEDPNAANVSRLAEVEQEFDVKFEALMKEYENDHDRLREQLARDREEDINAYQKYEADFRELKEEEEFIRGNIDKLDDDDPCKQDFIIDIIRVQRKMEEVRLQLEMKEVTIIKRENSYRKFFPETEEKPESAIDESKNANYVYEYNHGAVDKEVGVAQNAVENRVSPPENKSTEISGTDLRIKLERERLLKRLGPELESVDPALREKLLSVILEKDKESDSLKPSKDGEPGDTRQVVKDDDVRMRELAKKEKQLELELANLKSAEKKKKKTVPKSLVPQYDDVDDKKKDPKRKSRKRSVSSSSSSRSSSSSSDSSYYKNKKKRKSSPTKTRVKTKRSGSLDKSRRKRRSRSISREREKRKRAAVKKGKDDEKKKRIDRSKGERKRTDKLPGKKPSKVEKHTIDDDNDSDVQVITPVTVQPISVLGSASVAHSNKSSVSNIIQVSSIPLNPSTSTSTVRGTSNIPPQRKEQFSFWKNPVVAPAVVTQPPPPKESPKEDIWDTAFSGGNKEDTAGSGTLNIFDPQGGAQLPEDILNILKSVAPIIQQTQNNSPYKQSTSRTSLTGTHVNSNSSSSYNTQHRPNNQSISNKTIEEKKDDKIDSRGIRSILKKVIDPLPVAEDPPKESPTVDHQPPEIPGLDSSTGVNHATAAVAPGRQDHGARSILKPQSEFKDHLETNKSYYNDSLYSTNEENGRREPNHDPPLVKDDYLHNQRPTPVVRDPSSMKTYDRDSLYDNRNLEVEDKEMPSYDSVGEYRRSIIPPPVDRHDPYSETDPYRPPPIERERMDRVISPRLDNRSPSVGSGGRLGPESMTSYDADRSLRGDRDPYVRSEVTHRVIDYSYVRDTRVIPGDTTTPPARYNDDTLKQPVRYPGETDDEYYARFERFYEMNRRNEEKRAERDRDVPRRVVGDTVRLNPEVRVPQRDDYYAPKDRYDDRLARPPLTDTYRSRVPPDDRIPSLSGRVIDESVRRIERIPYKDDVREPNNRAPYQQVVEITKRVEDKSVRDTNPPDRPYRWSETVESRYTTDNNRNARNDFSIRDASRDLDARSTLPRLPPPRVPLPRGVITGLPRARLPRPAPAAGDFDKFQDY